MLHESQSPPFTVRSISSLPELLRDITNLVTADISRKYLWRGQSDSAWGVQPALYRRLLVSLQADPPSEDDIVAHETDLIRRAMAFDYYQGNSYASSLALLQHHGAATR